MVSFSIQARQIVRVCLLLLSTWFLRSSAINPNNFPSPPNPASLPSSQFFWSRYPSSGVSPPKRAFLSGATDRVNKKYLVYGGGEGPIGVGQAFNDLWEFDLVRGLWTVLPSNGPRHAPPRQGCISGAAVLLESIQADGGSNRDLILYGGGDEKSIFGDVEVYSLNTRYYSTLLTAANPKPLERKDHAMFVRNGKAYTFGGQSQTKLLTTLWELTFDRSSPISSWRIANSSGGLGLTPPAMSSMLAAYDHTRDLLWVWHGLYEEFNTQRNQSATSMRGMKDSSWSQLQMGLADSATSALKPFLPRTQSCTWYYRDQLYMFGGWNQENGDVFNHLYVANVSGLADPFRFIDVTNQYAKMNFNTLPERRAHDCKLFDALPLLNKTTPGVLMFGGITKMGITNDLYWLDLEQKQWTQIRFNADFPTPRAYHATALLGNIVYMFGGMDATGGYLGDFWSARLTISADLLDFPNLVWVRERVLSTKRPLPRIQMASASSIGLMLIFGGRDEQGNILDELWRFQPVSSEWQLVQASSSTSSLLPTGRYGHTMIECGPFVYMFGGMTDSGHSDELWQLDPLLMQWMAIKPAFPGAVWPERRVFHATAHIQGFVSVAMMRVVTNYLNTISSMAAAMIRQQAQQDDSVFPASTQPGVDAVASFNQSVISALDLVKERIRTLTVNEDIPFMVIHGGLSADVGGASVGDMFVFDTVAQLWHVPGEFSSTSDVRGTGRHKHTARLLGRVLVIQGGQDDIELKPASPAHLSMLLNGKPQYSFPYSAWPRSNKFIGQSTDLFNGGIPPSPQALAVTHLLSMPPLVFTTAPAFEYLDGDRLTDFFDPASNSIKFPPTSSWGTVGTVAGHSAIKFADSLLYIGGFGRLADSTSPVGVESAVNMRVIRARVTPICPFWELTNQSEYQSGAVQLPSPLLNRSPCFRCLPGSRVLFSSSGAQASCQLCPGGSFSDVTGAVDCKPCPAGFYSNVSGGSNIQSCLPCPAGFYQNLTGQRQCNPCPLGFICRLAAIHPSLTAVPLPTIVEIQPNPLPDADRAVQTLTISTVSGCMGLLLIWVIVAALAHCHSWFDLGIFDVVFVAKHHIATRPQLPVKDPSHRWKDFYLTEWSTPLGGVISVSFMILSLILILLLTLPFEFDNLSEAQSLVPNLSQPSDFRKNILTDMWINVTLTGYSDQCQTLPSNSCNSKVSYSSYRIASRSPEGEKLFCRKTAEGCLIMFQCLQCDFQGDLAAFHLISLQEFAYAESLQWQLSTTSGIQLIDMNQRARGIQISQIGSAISPPEPGYVFRGSAPSLVSVRTSYSTYSAPDTLAPKSNGYLVQFSGQTVGSNIPDSLFPLVPGISFAVNFSRSDNTFATKHTLKQNAQQSLASLAGALSALLGGCASLLRLLEGFFFMPKGFGTMKHLEIDEQNRSQDGDESSQKPESSSNTKPNEVAPIVIQMTNLRASNRSLPSGSNESSYVSSVVPSSLLNSLRAPPPVPVLPHGDAGSSQRMGAHLPPLPLLPPLPPQVDEEPLDFSQSLPKSATAARHGRRNSFVATGVNISAGMLMSQRASTSSITPSASTSTNTVGRTAFASGSRSGSRSGSDHSRSSSLNLANNALFGGSAELMSSSSIPLKSMRRFIPSRPSPPQSPPQQQ